MHQWERFKPQGYLYTRQESLRSWRNWRRQVIKTLDFMDISLVRSGTWSAGCHGRGPCRAKVPSRPHWCSMSHGRRAGQLHKEHPAEPKPSGTCRGYPTAVPKHCPGARGEKANVQLELPRDRRGLCRYTSSKMELLLNRLRKPVTKAQSLCVFLALVFPSKAYSQGLSDKSPGKGVR